MDASLYALLRLFPNNRCVDCHLVRAEGLPFVSLTHRVFLCEACAARIGSDALLAEERQSLELEAHGGNLYGGEVWMSNQTIESIRPRPNDSESRREQFVESIYSQRMFYSPEEVTEDQDSSDPFDVDSQAGQPKRASIGGYGELLATSMEDGRKVSYSAPPEQNVIEYNHLLSEYNILLNDNYELKARVLELEDAALPNAECLMLAVTAGPRGTLPELEQKIDQLEEEMVQLMEDFKRLVERNSELADRNTELEARLAELEEMQHFTEDSGSQGLVERLQQTLDYFLLQLETIHTPEDVTTVKLKLLGEMEQNGLAGSESDGQGREWERLIEDNRSLSKEVQELATEKDALTGRIAFYETLIGYREGVAASALASGSMATVSQAQPLEAEVKWEEKAKESRREGPRPAPRVLKTSRELKLTTNLLYELPTPPPLKPLPASEEDIDELQAEMEDLRIQNQALEDSLQESLDAQKQVIGLYDSIIAHGYTPATIQQITEQQAEWSTPLTSVLNRVLEDQQKELLEMLDEIRVRIDEEGFTQDSLQLIQAVDERFKTQLLQLFLSVVELQKSLLKEEMIKQEAALRKQLETLQAQFDELKAASDRDAAELLKVKKAHAQEMATMKREYNLTLEQASEPYQEEIKSIQKSYLQEKSIAEYLRNELVEIKGNIRVYARVRPFLPFDQEDRNMLNISCQDKHLGLSTPYYGYDYEFDRCFGQDSEQGALFDEIRPYLDSLLEGYNMCIFAYGQTGTGKTYTMDDKGINWRTLGYLFDRIEQDASCTYQVQLSVLEIYNETIKDLNVNKKPDQKPITTFQEKSGVIHVENIELTRVTSCAEARELIRLSCSQRSTSAHRLNPNSSRSHLILTIQVTRTERVSKKPVTTQSRLNLVDLAGSESIDKTGVTGAACMEAQNINRSLSALGNVISALAERKKHVPYRDSKLTFVLHDSLSIGAKVIMFVTIAPGFENLGESLNSLNFAKRCRETELSPLGKERSESLLAKLEVMRARPVEIKGGGTLLVARPTRLLLPYYKVNTYNSHLDEDLATKDSRIRRSTNSSVRQASIEDFLGQLPATPMPYSRTSTPLITVNRGSSVSFPFVPNRSSTKTFTPRPFTARSTSMAAQRATVGRSLTESPGGSARASSSGHGGMTFGRSSLSKAN